jgi:hypothetical protein
MRCVVLHNFLSPHIQFSLTTAKHPSQGPMHFNLCSICAGARRKKGRNVCLCTLCNSLHLTQTHGACECRGEGGRPNNSRKARGSRQAQTKLHIITAMPCDGYFWVFGSFFSGQATSNSNRTTICVLLLPESSFALRKAGKAFSFSKNPKE